MFYKVIEPHFLKRIHINSAESIALIKNTLDLIITERKKFRLEVKRKGWKGIVRVGMGIGWKLNSL